MKPAIRLCDFWQITKEETINDNLRITGLLHPAKDVCNLQPDMIVAIFTPQEGPKGSWITSNYESWLTAPSPDRPQGRKR